MTIEIPTTTERITSRLFHEFDSPPEAVLALLEAMEDGWRIPYISRFLRKEVRGMPERRMYEIRERLNELRMLEERKSVLLARAREKDLLDEDFCARILACRDIELLDELFLPMLGDPPSPAVEAIRRGLGPLARRLLARDLPEGATPADLAAEFAGEGKGVPDAETALAGARVILRETIAQDSAAIEALLAHCEVRARAAKGGKTPPRELRRYTDFTRPMGQVHWRDFLNLQKAARKGYFDLHFGMPEEKAHFILTGLFCKGLEDPADPLRSFFDSVLRECWHERLKGPLERAVHRQVKDRADRGGIRVFARHYRDFLMASPVGRIKVCGVLPAIRKPTRAVVVNEGGVILEGCNLHPLKVEQKEESTRRILDLANRHEVTVLALGGGPGCREVEAFLMEAFAEAETRPQILTIEEAGATQLAHRAHDRHDLRTRKAAILARRAQDPLAEWCGLEPDLIPLGPGQEEIRPSLFRTLLEDVRESVLHEVGVDLRTVRTDVLAKIAGLDPQKAQKIAKLRNSGEGMPDLASLVAQGVLDERSYEQAAPFLKYTQSTNPLDATRLPPSRYDLVERIAASLGLSTGQLLQAPETLDRLDERVLEKEDLPEREFRAVLDEIRRPFRDPRPRFEILDFPKDRRRLEDLEMGQALVGRVTRMTDFGAFVDVGVPPGGLLHVSEMSEDGPRDPHRLVRIGQVVRVRVLDVDVAAGRLSLTMRSGEIRKVPRTLGDLAEGKRKPGAVVVRPGSGEQVERGRNRGARHVERERRGGRDGRRPGGRGRPAGREAREGTERGFRRGGGGDRARFSQDRPPRGKSYTVESEDLDKAVKEDRGFKGELKSLGALADLLQAKTPDEPSKPPETPEGAPSSDEAPVEGGGGETPPEVPSKDGTGTQKESPEESAEETPGMGEGFV